MATALPENPVPPVVTIKQWCEDFSESRNLFHQRVRAGEVRIIKRGRRTLIPRDEYLRHVKRLNALARTYTDKATPADSTPETA